MVTTAPIPAAEVRAALRPVLDWLDATLDPPPAGGDPLPTAGDPPVTAGASPPEQPARPTLAAAVRVSLRAFAQAYPGKSVEIRVPPFAAVQCLPGGAHTRGTPPHVIETDPRTWLLLVTGRLTWSDALGTARVNASGHRTDDVGALLPWRIATESDRNDARFE